MPGKRYALEYVEGLVTGAWTTVLEINASADVSAVTDNDVSRTQNATGFYRVRVLPEN